jgi:hypothetical protein
MLAWTVIRDSGDRRRPGYVMEQAGDHELGIVIPLLTRECGALQGVLQLVDRLTVVRQADHGTAGGDDLINGVSG